MNRAVKVMTVAGAAIGLLAAAVPGRAADEFCPMGGVLVKVEVDADKAKRFVEDERRKSAWSEEDKKWRLVATTRSSQEIAMVFTAEGVFFGVAERDERAVTEREAEKAFGRDFRDLKEVVKREVGDIWKAGVIRIGGNEVNEIADAVGLGTLEKSGRAWELKTVRCEGKAVSVSDLR